MDQKEILNRICSHYDDNGKALIERAAAVAAETLKESRRSDGVPFFEHPLGVAEIVCEEIGLSAECVAAVFLHEASRVDKSLEDILRKSYPAEIVDIALALNKISLIKPKDTSLEADRYRKLIVSYSKDPRVFIIKLADRLEMMRSLGKLPKIEAARKNAETLFLYIPLAHQTGLYNIKAELENLWLKYAHPEEYRTITNQLKAGEKDREALVTEFVEPLEAKLKADGIKYILKARTKSAYSIWKKMQVQGIPFSQVYDVFAIRFIIDATPEKEIDLCWQVYSLVTEKYEPDTNRLRDWLTVPKENGYQSLHTTVRNDRGNYVEVQIRTERMDYEAEIGIAAHWSYKGVKREDSLNQWLATVRKMMENPASTENSYSGISSGDVFVFSPDGALRQLREGATVLDFAFDIHTNVGLKCTGGKINGKMVQIREKLKTGDVVEILTNKNQKPSSDWLDVAVTSKARSKIRQKLNEAESKLAAQGKEIIDRRVRNWKMEPLAGELLASVVKRFKFKAINEFYAAVGAQQVDLMELKSFLETSGVEAEKSGMVSASGGTAPDSSQIKGDYLVIGKDGKLKGIDYKMAKCCNPVYGDEVFGFVTVSDGIKIHRMSCPNASRLLTYSHRVQKVRWKEGGDITNFQAGLRVLVEEEEVAENVFAALAGFGASIRSYNLRKRQGKGDFEVMVTMLVRNSSLLDNIMASLRKMKDIKQVSRV